MKKFLLYIFLYLSVLNNSVAATLEEDWEKDTKIYMEGINQCAEVYAHKSGSFNSDHYWECVNQFKAMNSERIEARELARKDKCEKAKRKNASIKGSSSFSNAENFLLGVLSAASENIACGY